MCADYLAHLLRRCTRLLMVLPSRQRSAMCSILSCEDGQNGFFLFIALGRMVTFCKEGGGMLLVWALRACSYKTKAEDWAAGHRPPSSSRGLSWFLSCLKQWVQEVRGIILTTVFHISSLHSSSSQYHILISRKCTRTRNIYIM